MGAETTRIVTTAAVADWAAGSNERGAWLTACLDRHLAGDWGNLDAEDVAANRDAVRRHQGRILSAYDTPTELSTGAATSQLWIITDDLEDPDTATTLLWPSDY